MPVTLDSVMAALITSAIVDSASCYDRHICTVFDIKIIIYKICHSRYTDNNRNINYLAFCFSIDINVYSRFILFLFYLNMFAVSMTY